jgi:hypothetical protein
VTALVMPISASAQQSHLIKWSKQEFQAIARGNICETASDSIRHGESVPSDDEERSAVQDMARFYYIDPSVATAMWDLELDKAKNGEWSPGAECASDISALDLLREKVFKEEP